MLGISLFKFTLEAKNGKRLVNVFWLIFKCFTILKLFNFDTVTCETMQAIVPLGAIKSIVMSLLFRNGKILENYFTDYEGG